MAIAFPSGATAGTTYTDPGSGQSYVFDGAKWQGNAGGIRRVESITQASYSSLVTKDPTVLYLIS